MCFCDSKKKPLIRAADIVANRIYFFSKRNKINQLKEKVLIINLP
ncbi:hypothetical protein [Staphylococcus epidermidis]